MRTINLLQRMNIYQEVFLSILYRVLPIQVCCVLWHWIVDTTQKSKSAVLITYVILIFHWHGRKATKILIFSRYGVNFALHICFYKIFFFTYRCTLANNHACSLEADTYFHWEACNHLSLIFKLKNWKLANDSDHFMWTQLDV